MATLELIAYRKHQPNFSEGQVAWLAVPNDSPPKALPQIIWRTGEPWSEANLWALDQLLSPHKDPQTVLSQLRHLHAYAKWLEAEQLDWRHFPDQQSDRCLVRYRGALVTARNDAVLAPSTVSARMAAVVRFYRWLRANHLVDHAQPLWNEKTVALRFRGAFGLEHTLAVVSTDLSIPNRSVRGGPYIEDGLTPLSLREMREVLAAAEAYASTELKLMLLIGFHCGLRLGSITDLRIGTIDGASLDPLSGWRKLSVGPGARPPVQTKFDVTGHVPIPNRTLMDVRAYCTSTRRLKRVALASPEDRDLVFLTRFGKPYHPASSRAVNVEMGRLRRTASANGVTACTNFSFHQSRATFATGMMRLALQHMAVADAIDLVRASCLHRNEATTMKYVKFVRTEKAASTLADAYTEAFLGVDSPTGMEL